MIVRIIAQGKMLNTLLYRDDRVENETLILCIMYQSILSTPRLLLATSTAAS